MSNVRDNTELSRFEMDVSGQTAFIDYWQHGNVITMTHAEVPASLQGRGIGSTLVKGTLDLVRSRRQIVVPRCPFIAIYIRRHPDYQSLLAQ